MRKETDNSKVIDTHSEVFGKKYYLILVLDKIINTKEITASLIRVLKCDELYAEDRIEEALEFGRSYIYASCFERCELMKALFERDGSGVLTTLSEY